VQVERPAVRATSETNVLGWSAQGWNVDDVLSGDRRRFSTARKSLERVGSGERWRARCWVLRDRPGNRGYLKGLALEPLFAASDGAPTVL
jgi:hypothetical protein